MRNSLRLRLLLWLLFPLTVYVAAAGFMGYGNAQRTATLIQDNALLSSAKVMSGDVKWEGETLRADISPSAIEILSTPAGDSVYFRIGVIDGASIAGTSELPQRTPVSSPTWYDTVVEGQSVRAVSIIRTMYDAGIKQRVLISVGRTQMDRDATAARFWQPRLLNLMEIVGIAIVLMCVGLTFELRQLMALTNDLRDRAPDTLTPLSTARLQTELRPIVDAINQCISRIALQTAMQRRFIAHSAHQLRTPLTLLGAQLQYARRSDDPAVVKETLRAIHESHRSLVSLTNQLLMLAQAESADYDQFDGERVDLCELSTTTIEQLALHAQRRGIHLAAQLCQDALVLGNPRLLSIMIFNLMDNAIRYTPREGQVTLSIEKRDESLALTISDDGPGIAPDMRERVFEPFFRISTEEGSGLGLAIVREIVRAHRGQIVLAAAAQGTGLCAEVTFLALSRNGDVT
ncbi:sensor histidine kinase N-terminal domain-containing protein [Robbsia sp. KACC 23696]|uniref:sensor histidine kinase n=1 Tax=Robbsia sp. KACC 23696 TaxID=3149231 RepID=UPI00325AF96C